MSLTIKSVLLADDDADDVLVFQDAFHKACASVKLQVVNDGNHLMKLLEVIPVPDLILLDLNMPGIDGKECLRMIRSDTRLDTAIIMMFSISKNHYDIEHCLNNGANFYTVKFGSLRQLGNLVDDICKGELKNIFTISD